MYDYLGDQNPYPSHIHLSKLAIKSSILHSPRFWCTQVEQSIFFFILSFVYDNNAFI